MYGIFTKILNMSMSAGIFVFAVIFLRIILKNVPKKFICVLWALVALSLVCPFSIPSPLSIFNLLNTKPDAASKMEYFKYNEKTEKPEMTFSVPALVNDNTSPDRMTVGLHTSSVYLPTFMYIWMAGVAIMLLYAVISYLRLKKEVSASILVKDNLHICDEVKSPFILGVFCPRIYLPSGISGDVRENVIAHERAHIKRLDHWWKPLGFILLAVYWFNPVIWVAYILFCEDIEAACDERVIQNMDKEGKIKYSEALLACAMQRKIITVCPLAFGENDVKGRVKRILNYQKPAFWAGILSVIVCIVAAVLFLTNPYSVKASDSLQDGADNNTAKRWFYYNDSLSEDEKWSDEQEIETKEPTSDKVSEADISYGTSLIYSKHDMDEAIEIIMSEFGKWEGCELHSISYYSDDICDVSNIEWMNELEKANGGEEHFTQCIMFTSNFHSPKDNAGAWNPDEEYTGWEWWLARSEGGQWKLMTFGYN